MTETNMDSRRLFLVLLISIHATCIAGPLYPAAWQRPPVVHCERKDRTNFFGDYEPDNQDCHRMTLQSFDDYAKDIWQRFGIAVGDKTNCGLVISVVRPIVKIQTNGGEAWLRIDEVFPLIESKDGKPSPLMEVMPKCPLNAK